MAINRDSYSFNDALHPLVCIDVRPAEDRALHKCPVCEGRGTMPWWFYESSDGTGTTGMTDPKVGCKSCNGRGIVY